jgi:Holliday junction DNA helicase RuvA
MISLLRGEIVDIRGQSFILDVSGVGYEVLGTTACLSTLELGATAKVIVFTDVKEDSIRLFGFASQLEKQVFHLLMNVKGIGTKTSMQIVSKIEARELLRLIGLGDLTKLSSVKGIGKKTAERIIVELRDKVGEYVVDAAYSNDDSTESSSASAISEARAALRALGFSQADAERALAAAEKTLINRPEDSGEYVKEALRHV